MEETVLPPGTTSAVAAGAALNSVVHPREAGGEPGEVAGALFVAVVHTVDAVRFVAVSAHRAELLRRLAHYVAHRGPEALWPPDAERVRAHLAEGAPEAAVAHYFAVVGRRWDEEWLVTAEVGADALGNPELLLERGRDRHRIPASSPPTARERRRWPHAPRSCLHRRPPSLTAER